MNKESLYLIVGLLLGALIAVSAPRIEGQLSPSTNAEAQSTKTNSRSLTESELEELFLYGQLTDQGFIGRYFNQNVGITVTELTLEKVPDDESNRFNQFSPRFFSIYIQVRPRTFSHEFTIDMGAVNPEFHTLRIHEAVGVFSANET